MAAGGPELNEQARKFQAAVVAGNVQEVQRLLSQNQGLANLTFDIFNSSHKTSVLHDAVRAAASFRPNMEKQIAMLKIIALLIENGADPKTIQRAAGSAVDYPEENVFGTARRLHDRSQAPTPFEAAYYPQLESVLSGKGFNLEALQFAASQLQVRQFRQSLSQQQTQPQPQQQYYPAQGNQQQGISDQQRYEAWWAQDPSRYWKEIAPFWNSPGSIPDPMLNAAISFINKVYQQYGTGWTDEYKAHYQALVSVRDWRLQQMQQQQMQQQQMQQQQLQQQQLHRPSNAARRDEEARQLAEVQTQHAERQKIKSEKIGSLEVLRTDIEQRIHRLGERYKHASESDKFKIQNEISQSKDDLEYVKRELATLNALPLSHAEFAPSRAPAANPVNVSPPSRAPANPANVSPSLPPASQAPAANPVNARNRPDDPAVAVLGKPPPPITPAAQRFNQNQAAKPPEKKKAEKGANTPDAIVKRHFKRGGGT